MLTIEWQGEHLTLDGRGGLYWSARGTLIIADPHFGKDAHFRQKAIPVPHGTMDSDLKRLSAMIDSHAARRLMILGDFFHTAAGARSVGMVIHGGVHAVVMRPSAVGKQLFGIAAARIEDCNLHSQATSNVQGPTFNVQMEICAGDVLRETRYGVSGTLSNSVSFSPLAGSKTRILPSAPATARRVPSGAKASA